MAEPSQDHPGFGWIMENFGALMRDYPSHWIVADRKGFVMASADQQELLGALRDRVPSELAIVYMDLSIMRASPPNPRNLPPRASGGGPCRLAQARSSGRERFAAHRMPTCRSNWSDPRGSSVPCEARSSTPVHRTRCSER
jgi:hypothetical protein